MNFCLSYATPFRGAVVIPPTPGPSGHEEELEAI